LRFCCTLAIVVDGTVLQQAWFDCVRYRALQICQSLQSLRLGAAGGCFSAIGLRFNTGHFQPAIAANVHQFQ
jgi:hypothetical protein